MRKGRAELEPLLNLQSLLEEFIARVPERAEGGPEANELQRRVDVALQIVTSHDTGSLLQTFRFLEKEVATVDMAENALQEVSALTHRGRSP